MQQHPIPQNISSYEFRLVGDMTLKQFFQLAGGVVVALIFYASGLPGIVKWPLVIFFALLGAALAFLPFEDRSLLNWFIAFIKAVYSPTKYTWTGELEDKSFREKNGVSQQPVLAALQGEEKATIYLKSTPQPKVFSNFESQESSFVKRVAELFQTVQVTPQQQEPVQPTLQRQTVEEISYTPIEKPQQPIQKPMKPKPQYTPQKVEPILYPSGQGRLKSTQASFSSQASPPSPPTQPNTIVGQVLEFNGRIVEGAILEVQDSTGIPVRAFKTNKLGHFLNMTPLKNGDYTLTIEKENLVFEPVFFKTKGEIIKPILIRAKNQLVTN